MRSLAATLLPLRMQPGSPIDQPRQPLTADPLPPSRARALGSASDSLTEVRALPARNVHRPGSTGAPVEHGQVSPPRPHRLAILLGHHARGLRDVAKVVRDPRGQQLPKRDGAELRVLPLERELLLGELPRAERVEVRRAQTRELVEQVGETLATAIPNVREAVEGLEASVSSASEDDPGTRNPVGALAVDQVPEVVEGAERIGTFVGHRPCVGEPREERVHSRGSALEDFYGFVELKAHRIRLVTHFEWVGEMLRRC